MTSIVNKSGNDDIDALLWGYKWDQTSFTYSFPTSATEYLDKYINPSDPLDTENGYQKIDGFVPFSSLQQNSVRTILDNISSFTKLTFTETTAEDANFRFAEATAVNYADDTSVIKASPTSNLHNITTGESNPPELAFNGVSPSTASYAQGDAWFNTTNYTNPTVGSGAYSSGLMHEIGHNLGLKHGQTSQDAHGVTFGTLSDLHNSFEYSVMTYSQHPFDPDLPNDRAPDHPTTYMQDDIAALQYLYGANYDYNSSSTTYKWDKVTGEMSVVNAATPYLTEYSPYNQTSHYTLMTVWDGGGSHDIYDFSNFTTDMSIDLAPGAYTVFDTSPAHQLRANLGDGYIAVGNVFNALVDPRDATKTASFIEDANGGTGNDVLYGNSIGNILNGGAGNDALNGREGRDTLIGGPGDDNYYLGDVNQIAIGHPEAARYDTIKEDLNGGNDTVHVWPVSTHVTSYTLPTNVENGGIEGDKPFDLIGNEIDNNLYGNSAANTLRGGAGKDLLVGNGGADMLYGGKDDDLYWVDDASARVIENPNEGIDWVATHLKTYTLGANVENLQMDQDGSVNETMIGSGNGLDNVMVGQELVPDGLSPSGAFYFYGYGGDDTLTGGNGLDVLDGGANDDTLYGLGGNDVLRGGLGADKLVGGEGTDLADYSLATAGVVVDLVSGGHGGEAAGDTFDSIEDIRGSRFADRISGDAGANNLSGRADDDIIDGHGGDDTLTGGQGNDTFVFTNGWGDDRITDFTHGADIIDLTGVSGLTSMSQLHIDSAVQGTNITFGADSIQLVGVHATSLTAADFHLATAGHIIDGTASWGGTITGSAGVDTASFATANYGVYADLTRDGGYLESATSTKQTAHISGVENLTGSLDYMSSLHGDQNDNVLIGGNSTDWLEGRGGNNTLIGGDGFDYADYADSGGNSVTIDLTIGKAFHGTNVDTLSSIEQFRGSYFDDTFIGDNSSNYYINLGGNDKIYGNGGNDWLDGSAGNNLLDGGAGNDTLISGYGNDVMTGGADKDTFVFMDNAQGHDEITDFNAAEGDRLDFSETAFGGNVLVNQMSDVAVTDDGHGNAMLSYATPYGTSTIVLDHVAPSAVSAGWFVF